VHSALENVEVDRSLVSSGYCFAQHRTASSVLHQPSVTRMDTAVPGPLVSANGRACPLFEYGSERLSSAQR